MSRSAVLPGDLVRVMRPFFQSRKTLDYGHEACFRLSPDLLSKNKLLLRALYSIQKNMSFKKSVVLDALQILSDEADAFGMTEDKAKQWREVNERKMHMMCRHVEQSLVRAKTPKWACELLEIEMEEPDAQVEPDDKDEPDVECEDSHVVGPKRQWTIGYDAEHDCVWRLSLNLSSRKKGAREWAVNLMAPEDMSKSSPMIAEFENGDRMEVPNMLFGDHEKKLANLAKARRKAAHFYEDMHVLTGHKISVVVRPDRKMLISMKEQGGRFGAEKYQATLNRRALKLQNLMAPLARNWHPLTICVGVHATVYVYIRSASNINNSCATPHLCRTPLSVACFFLVTLLGDLPPQAIECAISMCTCVVTLLSHRLVNTY